MSLQFFLEPELNNSQFWAWSWAQVHFWHFSRATFGMGCSWQSSCFNLLFTLYWKVIRAWAPQNTYRLSSRPFRQQALPRVFQSPTSRSPFVVPSFSVHFAVSPKSSVLFLRISSAFHTQTYWPSQEGDAYQDMTPEQSIVRFLFRFYSQEEKLPHGRTRHNGKLRATSPLCAFPELQCHEDRPGRFHIGGGIPGPPLYAFHSTLWAHQEYAGLDWCGLYETSYCY